jgi:hypothetical protein
MAVASSHNCETNGAFVFTRADRKESGTPTTLMAQFNLEPKVTLFAESSTSSGYTNDKDDNLHN